MTVQREKIRYFATILTFGASSLFSAAGSAQSIAPRFNNISQAAGLSQIKSNKYFSPTVADLDRDGYYDLILSNHGGKSIGGVPFPSPEMYWGSSTGFRPFVHKTPLRLAIPTNGTDFHGFSAGYFGNQDDYPDLVFSLGGRSGTGGNLPITAEFTGAGNGRDYIVRKDQNRTDGLVDPSLQALGIDGHGRGRSSFFIDIDQDGDLDLVYNNAGPKPGTSGTAITDSKFIYEWQSGKFNRLADIGELKDNPSGLGALVDVNHDDRLDLLYFEGNKPLQAWTNLWQGPGFRLDNSFFPFRVDKVTAAAEIDYDGDGDLDLYLTRSAYRGGEDDYLFEWDQTQKKYVDVSRSARLPQGGMHMGISVGDFDNNGYQDIFISRYSADNARLNDLILMNQGDKTFRTVENHGATVLSAGEDGNQTEVFDYDRDGKLDILSGSVNGPWRLFQNKTRNDNGNFVSVRVGRSINAANHAPLGATVIVVAQKGQQTKRFIRRIGSQGQSHAQSFLDTMHFGLGEFDTIVKIIVKYGSYKEVTSFESAPESANKTITVGDFFER